MTVNNGDLVTIGSTNATQIILSSTSKSYTSYCITVVSGTLKVGEKSISANAYAYPTGQILISCNNGDLYVQAGSSSDTFAITGN